MNSNNSFSFPISKEASMLLLFIKHRLQPAQKQEFLLLKLSLLSLHRELLNIKTHLKTMKEQNSRFTN